MPVGTPQFFVAFNFGLEQAALTDIFRNRAWGVGTAAYVASSNLLTAVIGSITALVFHDPSAAGISIRIVAPCSFVLAAAIFRYGLRPYSEAACQRVAPGLNRAESLDGRHQAAIT